MSRFEMTIALVGNLVEISIRKLLGLSTWSAKKAFVWNLKRSAEMKLARDRAEYKRNNG